MPGADPGSVWELFAVIGHKLATVLDREVVHDLEHAFNGFFHSDLSRHICGQVGYDETWMNGKYSDAFGCIIVGEDGVH